MGDGADDAERAAWNELEEKETGMETEIKTITGVCNEIAQKPGSDWCEFHIDGGGKYPVKLSTKLSPLIEAGKEVGGNLATWTFKESDGNPNPHKPGEFYKNRYLESVEVGGSKSTGSVATPDAAPHHQPLIAGDKDRAITRMACLKAACQLHQGQGYWSLTKDDVLTDTALQVMTTAARFETWIYRDIGELPFESGLSEHDDQIPF